MEPGKGKFKYSGLLLFLVIAILLAVSGGAIAPLKSQPVYASPGVLYVASDGNCNGYTPCYSSVQAAVNAASTGDVIKVAAGTYTGINNSGGSTQVLYINKTVTVSGGYTTTNWDTPDPSVNLTILDAQGQGRVIYIVGSISPVIEGLRITGGQKDFGGGVFVDYAAPTLRNNQVYNNSATGHQYSGGGGMYLHESAATLSNNTFTGNTAGWSGGGLQLHKSPATLINNTITSNTASSGFGGGIHLSYSDATLTGNTFTFNTTTDTDIDEGGGAHLYYSNAWLTGNTFTSNTATYGGGLYITLSDDTRLIGNTISSNTARDNGGGLHTYDSDITLTGNTISSNTAGTNGGGLFLSYSAPTLGGNIITDNNAPGNGGGGLFLHRSDATFTNNVIADNQAGVTGSGLYIMGSWPQLLHTTLVHNLGTGIYIVNDSMYSPPRNSSVTLTNSIIVSHTFGIQIISGNMANLNGTLWNGNSTNWSGSLTHSNDHYGVPAFVNPAADDYHIIGPDSAAFDTGVASGVHNDMDNEPCPYQQYDLGADEYWPPGVLQYIYLPLILKSYQ
ncbi:MAG: right-handed parallel beta-helix repeat-containing protein [Anaerolineae bacterium]